MATIDELDKNLKLINETRDEAVKKVYALATPRTVSSIIQMILSVAFSFGINIVTFGFDFSKLITWEFWVSSACTLAGVIMIFRATVNAVYYKISQRKCVTDAREEYKKLNDTKGLDFKDFLVIYNKKRKIELYIAKINAKIYKLENKQAKTLKEKKILRYEKKIAELKKLITAEYISEHIDRIPVKQTLVFYSDFTDLDSPVSSSVITRPNFNKEFNKRTYSKIIWYVASTILLGIGVWTAPEGNWITYVTSILLTTIMVVWRIMSAITQAPDIYDTTITKSILDRTNILKEYKQWQMNNPSSTVFEEQLKLQRQQIEEEYKQKMNKEIEEMKHQVERIANTVKK